MRISDFGHELLGGELLAFLWILRLEGIEVLLWSQAAERQMQSKAVAAGIS